MPPPAVPKKRGVPSSSSQGENRPPQYGAAWQHRQRKEATRRKDPQRYKTKTQERNAHKRAAAKRARLQEPERGADGAEEDNSDKETVYSLVTAASEPPAAEDSGSDDEVDSQDSQETHCSRITVASEPPPQQQQQQQPIVQSFESQVLGALVRSGASYEEFAEVGRRYRYWEENIRGRPPREM